MNRRKRIVFYAFSIAKCQALIYQKFPGAVPIECNIDEVDNSEHLKICCYILWMFEKAEKMDDIRQATGWVAWAQCRLEVIGIMKNADTRDQIRTDKFLGNTGN